MVLTNGGMGITQLILLVAITTGDLHDGDLLFLQSTGDNAITAVTTGVDSLPIDHVAVFHPMGGTPMVVEALPGVGVTVTPLSSFVTQGMIVVGRVGEYDVNRSIERVLRCVGLEYDQYYDAGNDAVYCSELVQQCYVDFDDNPVFEPIPMTFRDRSGNIPLSWVKHYAAIGRAVPEGEPGSNPGELSRRSNVSIIGLLESIDLP